MYCDVVNVQPRFNFSDEIIILNLELKLELGFWSIGFCAELEVPPLMVTVAQAFNLTPMLYSSDC